MFKPRVAVLRGGPSSEYEVSLKTGQTALKHIPSELYDVQDIFIARDGTWHKGGIPVAPHDVIAHTDVIFNALHGYYGEDGKLQHLLELHGIPFTGSGSFASALAMNKVLAKEVFVQEDIRTPQCLVLEEMPADDLGEIFRTFAPPVIVKPASGGSSFGVALVKTQDAFLEALTKAFAEGETVLVEEYIPGVEATVGVIDDFRGSETYALPPVEIRPHADKGKSFFDFDSKYMGASDEIVPGNFSEEDKRELEELAKKVHKALGLRHYSRSDFIVSPRRGIFVLESNALPGLTEESLLPKALGAVGASLGDFFDHLLTLAMKKK